MVRYIEDLRSLQKDEIKRSIVIGFFDGVHLGHQKLLVDGITYGAHNTIITFDTNHNKERLIRSSQKIELLQKFDYDEIIVIKMTKDNYSFSYQEFHEVLHKLNVGKITVGKDFCYGAQALGNIDTLNKVFDVYVSDFFEISGHKVSSTDIRKYLKSGDIEHANYLLGYNYTIRGRVVKGNQIGREINFPTANVITSGMVPKNGIYKTTTKINGIIYQSITNIGIRPTIDDNDQVSLETYIIDFNQTIYDQKIDVSFVRFIREEKKFETLDQLKAQIKKDIENAEEY